MADAALTERLYRALDFIRVRSRNYRLTFTKSYAAQTVLQDLAKFCRANESCYNDDPRLHAVLEGRREVWLRISNHLNLTPEQLFALYNGQNFNVQITTGDDDA